MKVLAIAGMHGMGDNIHQRAIVRQLLPHYDRIYLETSWFSIYHDMAWEGKLDILFKKTTLRTQTKNAAREVERFSKMPLPSGAERLRIWYQPSEVRKYGGVLAAMMAQIPKCHYEISDFRLPIRPEWDRALYSHLPRGISKPIMIYRPLTERTEWNGSRARNPESMVYRRIFDRIRSKYYVISIADLVPAVEWISGFGVTPDLAFHKGELPFEQLAALFARASLVYCAPGFAIPLAQAVGTPCIGVFGTYERSYSFSAGARYSPFLGIEPNNPKDGFRHDIADKTIDFPLALEKTLGFISAQTTKS